MLLSPLLQEEQCAERVTVADIAAAAGFASATRRREYLTWRAMLYDFLGEKVVIAVFMMVESTFQFTLLLKWFHTNSVNLHQLEHTKVMLV